MSTEETLDSLGDWMKAMDCGVFELEERVIKLEAERERPEEKADPVPAASEKVEHPEPRWWRDERAEPLRRAFLLLGDDSWKSVPEHTQRMLLALEAAIVEANMTHGNFGVAYEAGKKAGREDAAAVAMRWAREIGLAPGKANVIAQRIRKLASAPDSRESVIEDRIRDAVDVEKQRGDYYLSIVQDVAMEITKHGPVNRGVVWGNPELPSTEVQDAVAAMYYGKQSSKTGQEYDRGIKAVRDKALDEAADVACKTMRDSKDQRFDRVELNIRDLKDKEPDA